MALPMHCPEPACMHRYPLLALAPEGTCKHPNCLLTFSTGAFVGGRPVVPILLHYRARCARRAARVTCSNPCSSPVSIAVLHACC